MADQMDALERVGAPVDRRISPTEVPPWSFDGDLVEVAPDIAFVPSFANVSAMVFDGALLLVDTGSPVTAGLVHQRARTWTSAPLQTAVFSTAYRPRLRHRLHVWRRQFAVATQSALAATEEGGQRVRAVGFVDLVDFTRSSRSWDTAMLARTLERFESETARRVTARKGRVVKTLDDAIMYVIDDADAAVEVSLETVAAHDADDDLPRARAGVALGPVLQCVGDVFGECVNIASRLTGQARPSSVLIDRELAAALDDDPRFNLRRLRRRSVRGYRTMTPWLIRRQEPDAADA